MKAASRREAASYVRQTYGVSELRAGRAIGLRNSSLCYRSRSPAAEDLRRRLREPVAVARALGH